MRKAEADFYPSLSLEEPSLGQLCPLGEDVRFTAFYGATPSAKPLHALS